MEEELKNIASRLEKLEGVVEEMKTIKNAISGSDDAIGGAAVLEWESLQFITQVNLVAVILGTLFAFISGYICVRWMLAIMRKAHFSWFAYYCWVVGLLVIFISFF